MSLFGSPEVIEVVVRIGVSIEHDSLTTQIEAHDPTTGTLLAMYARPGRRRRSLGPELARTLSGVLELVRQLEAGTPPPASSDSATSGGAAAE